MTREYSVEVCKNLESWFRGVGLHRPMRVARYEVGKKLVYDIREVAGANKGRICAVVEKFVGGGFAGQVYRVKMLEIYANDGPIRGLEVGGFMH